MQGFLRPLGISCLIWRKEVELNENPMGFVSRATQPEGAAAIAEHFLVDVSDIFSCCLGRSRGSLRRRGGMCTRETGTIWQIGVLTAERSTFWAQKMRF